MASQDRVPKKYPQFDPNRIASYVDLPQVIERVKQLLQLDTLSPEQRIALSQLIEAYKIQQDGLDPQEELRSRR